MTEIALTVITKQQVVEVSSVPTIVTVLPGQGIGAANRIEVNFSWGDATPKLIYRGVRVREAAIAILEPFNVPSILQLGDEGIHDRLIGVGEVNTLERHEYRTTKWAEYPTLTDIKLWLQPGEGCNLGRGVIILEV